MATFCQGIEVTVYDAKGLRNTEVLGKQDPYCTIQLNGQDGPKQRTRVHQDGGRNATWNQKFTFRMSQINPSDILLARVWNENTMGDTKIGGTRIQLSSVVQNSNFIDQYFQLYKDRMGKGKVAGEVRLAIRVLNKNLSQPKAQAKPQSVAKPQAVQQRQRKLSGQGKALYQRGMGANVAAAPVVVSTAPVVGAQAYPPQPAQAPSYPPQPAQTPSYPPQPTAAYPPQPTAAYPPQPTAAYPPQPTAAYPPQPVHHVQAVPQVQHVQAVPQVHHVQAVPQVQTYHSGPVAMNPGFAQATAAMNMAANMNAAAMGAMQMGMANMHMGPGMGMGGYGGGYGKVKHKKRGKMKMKHMYGGFKGPKFGFKGPKFGKFKFK